MSDIKEVDANLLRKNNAVFHARRIQFKESTRVDLKQERLRQKYRPVNLPNGAAATATTTKGMVLTPSDVAYCGSRTTANTVTEDENGFKLPAKVLYSKEKVQLAWPQPRPIGPGLDNLGNTCYVNTILQCLTYTPPLANFLLSNQHSNSCKTTNFCMMCLLERHVSQCFDHSMNESVSPKSIVGRLRNIGKQFVIGRQEDAHEYIRCLIDGLQKSCLLGFDSKLDERVKETTVIHQIFGGYFQNNVKCIECEQESNTFEPFLDISVDIKGVESIQKALRDYTRVETMAKPNQYHCDKCNMLVDARKQMTIYEAPKILTVHLKRFTNSGQKIKQHIKFETKLDLSLAMAASKRPSELNYSLYAVVVHTGNTCQSGHYICYIKSSNGIWYSMNDTTVAVVSLQTVLSQNAYLLFYTQDKASNASPPKKPTNTSNNTKPRTVPSTVATAVKRPKLEDDEIGAKIDRKSFVIKEKAPKVKTEIPAPVAEPSLSKEEKIRLKKEKKKAQKQEKMKLDTLVVEKGDNKEQQDNLAAPPSTKASSEVVKSAASHSTQGTPSTTLPVQSSTDLPDEVEEEEEEVAPTSSTISDDYGLLNFNDVARKNKTKKMAEDHEMEEKQDEVETGEAQPEQEGSERSVKSRTVKEAIVVSHNEDSASKKEKLQALIARESEFKSAEVKETILGEVKHMLGSKVSTWEEPSQELTKAREAVLRTLKPKHHRPDAYDVEYDRGKVKKVKTKKITDGPAVGAKVGNKFQKEQDVRNLVK
ncbi:Ubiquitin carboxyl-terminal hydrolase 36, partial [Podila epigama]